ncbi:amidohydrolase [Mucilaginibacter pallidiroseus]|uniref:Amidohydrolase n=1 Tax=Mucilaginibacter pallidiroseus TaxID=2599295 RepID=A0A563U4Q8_9SPHI|nr:amidohydrolase [Mucilaginibacter pallidiroseus]TWR26319.1 amidohydrolase [Mucilaginibacter pallidiroseus]
MKPSLITIILFLAFTSGLYAQQKADLIITNGKFITLDDQHPAAEAIAITGNKIVAVGNNQQILRFKRAGSQMIDAKGKTVVPGIYDSHLHVIRGGRFFNTELRWDGVKTLNRALVMLKEQASRTPEGQWVRVMGGWTEYQFEEKRLPTLAEINEATGKTPTFILYLYGLAYLNKAGIEKLGITGDTPNPTGGLIQKDPSGQPTGLLIAEPSAFILYSTLSKLPELNQEEKVNSTRQFMSELNSLGITSVMDAGGGFQNFPDDYAITDLLAKKGELTVRLPYYLFAQKPGTELQDYIRWISMVDITEHSADNHSDKQPIEYHVQGGGENLVSSAGDFENFIKPRPELPAVMEGQLKAVINELVKHRWPFRLHATYNESITRFLNVIEQVNKETPLNGLTWFFDHAETVSDENLDRIKALGGGIAVQDRMAFQAETFISRYGKTAALNTPPVRRMLEKNIKVGGGTDGTRVSSYNPWIGIYQFATGRSVGGTPFTAKENYLDRITALKLYTQGSASLIHQEHDRGTLKEGYLADLVILSGDYLNMNEEDIKSIRSELTILNGKAVYGSGEFRQQAPVVPKALPAWSPVNFYGGYQHK